MTTTPFQRDHAPDRDAAEQEVQANLALLAGADEVQRLRLLGRSGDLLRALGRYDEAETLLRQALALAERMGDRRAEVANLIRLATTVQYADRHVGAEGVFRRALAGAADDASGYRDFALQHLGKCLVDMGRVSEAMGCFEQALALRQTKSDEGLITSTRAALAAARVLEDGEHFGKVTTL